MSSRRSVGTAQLSPAANLLAGGGAGMMEALLCHPLDTIKVRMQLSSAVKDSSNQSRGLFKTISDIVKQSPLAFYKGLGPVVTGIIPKMGIRFTSFEAYKSTLTDGTTGVPSSRATFLAGLAAGVTEAVTVVTTMEVVKVRLQSQNNQPGSLSQTPKYRNAAHALCTIVREEGVAALYSGASLTALRQATNVSVNLTAYTKMKQYLQYLQPAYVGQELPGYQTAAIGLVAGSMGPISNAPIDTIKTRVQKSPLEPGQTGLSHIAGITRDLFRQEGYSALYKGITPRIMRIGPGQAVTYTLYEWLRGKLTAG